MIDKLIALIRKSLKPDKSANHSRIGLVCLFLLIVFCLAALALYYLRKDLALSLSVFLLGIAAYSIFHIMTLHRKPEAGNLSKELLSFADSLGGYLLSSNDFISSYDKATALLRPGQLKDGLLAYRESRMLPKASSSLPSSPILDFGLSDGNLTEACRFISRGFDSPLKRTYLTYVSDFIGLLNTIRLRDRKRKNILAYAEGFEFASVAVFAFYFLYLLLR